MTFIRANAWLAVLTIVVLSIVPGDLRPHVMGNSYQEHFTAYFIAACLLTAAYSRRKQLLANWAVLTVCAGALEIIQLSIPGRNASIGDFATGTIGAWIGVAVTFVVSWIRGGATAIPLNK